MFITKFNRKISFYICCLVKHPRSVFFKSSSISNLRSDPLTMSYFDKLDNWLLLKYQQNLKIRKIIDIFLLIERECFNFFIISLLFDSPSQTIIFYIICNDFNSTIFEKLSNYNEVIWNLKLYRSISKRT
jgi:hypothetical protein